ncbi:MAG: signal recognition particle protein [Thermoproteota archaeon]|nr:MAG: signal recognition particle protein [Candidatus Korarchaeota archaeon]
MVLKEVGISLNKAVRRFLGLPLPDEKAVNEFIKDVQRILIKADVNVELVYKLTSRIREKSLKAEVPIGFSRRDVAVKTLYEELINLLGEKRRKLPIRSGRVNTLLFVGIEGSGKTTVVAKLARLLDKQYGKVGVISTDTIRPASNIQLEQMLPENIPVYFDPKKNPVEIAIDGIKKYKSEGYNVILIDTAGRHRNEKELINEMIELERTIKPDIVILVVDATIGQAAYAQAKAFSDATNVGAVIVTKLDSTAKGGGALSAVAVTGAPIVYVTSGESLEDIEEFDPQRFVSRLLGMGDIEELVKKMEEASVEITPEDIRKIASGKFTLLDFKNQIDQLGKLGPLSKLIDLIPGFSVNLPSEFGYQAQDKMKKWEVILKSMTKEELENPELIKRTRIVRIAKGSGVTVRDVKELLKAYHTMKKTLSSMGRRDMKKLMKKLRMKGM